MFQRKNLELGVLREVEPVWEMGIGVPSPTQTFLSP